MRPAWRDRQRTRNGIRLMPRAGAAGVFLSRLGEELVNPAGAFDQGVEVLVEHALVPAAVVLAVEVSSHVGRYPVASTGRANTATVFLCVCGCVCVWVCMCVWV